MIHFHCPAPHVIHHPSRCADHDLGPILETSDLFYDVLTPIDREDLYIMQILCVTVKFIRDLNRKLPCRTEDDSLQLFDLRINFHKERKPESSGLSRPGLCLPDQIPAGKLDRNRLLLNRRGRVKTHVGDGSKELFSETEPLKYRYLLCKRLRCTDSRFV